MKTLHGLFLMVFLLGVPCVCGADPLNDERAARFEPVLQDVYLQNELISRAQKMPADFDYSVFFKDADIVLVGEEHHDPIPARDINLMIKNLSQRKAGLTHIASEFLLSSEQNVLNQFAQGKIDYNELRKSCKRKSRAFVAEIARRYGVTVVGLDLPRAQEDGVWALSREGMKARNEAWADILLDIKDQYPRAKILVHAGSFHTQLVSSYYPTLPVLLQKQGVKTKTVEFVSETDPLWKKLGFNSKYDTLFVIPESLRKYVQADYVIFTTRAELSKEAQAQIEQGLKTMDIKGISGDASADGCQLDPDNPVCRVTIQSGRIKN